MRTAAWVVKNCKFAADWQGPLPKESYDSDKNPYGDLLGGEEFNPKTRKVKLPSGFIVDLDENASNQLSTQLEKVKRKEYLERKLDEGGENDVLADLAQKIGTGQGIQEIDYGLQRDGLHIYNARPGIFKEIAFVSNQDLADQYGIVVPLDESPSPPVVP